MPLAAGERAETGSKLIFKQHLRRKQFMGKQEYKIGCLLATATSHWPVWVPPWHELSQDIS